MATAAKQAALTALGKRLHAAWINAGLTQQWMSERLGVTPQSVRNWESGRSEPAEETVDKLAALYVVLPARLTRQPPESHRRKRSNHRTTESPWNRASFRRPGGRQE